MILIVPPNLLETAKRIIYSKTIKSIGNYSLTEFMGEKSWGRKGSYGRNYGVFPGSCDDYGYEIKTTKAMRKRGYKKSYFYEEWNELFPRFKQQP